MSGEVNVRFRATYHAWLSSGARPGRALGAGGAAPPATAVTRGPGKSTLAAAAVVTAAAAMATAAAPSCRPRCGRTAATPWP